MDNIIKIIALVKGTIALYPAKTNVLKDITNGEIVELSFIRTDDKINVFYKNIPCGMISLDSISDNLLKKIEVNKSYTGIASKKKKLNFSSEIYIPNKEDIYMKFKEEIERLQKENIDDDIFEKIDYLKVSGITDNVILSVIKSIKKYPSTMNDFLKKKPKNLFFEYDGLLNRAIIYISKGYHLRFKGERGLGKNVLVDTLAWLYRKPIVEFNCHNGVDKTDIQGCKTLEEKDGKTIIKFDISNIIKGAENGAFINLDEVNAVPPEVLLQIQSLADVNKKYIFIEGYGMVRANPDFKFLLTMNNGYTGTFQMNKATIDRFVTLNFTMPNTIKPLLSKIYPKINKKVINICEKLYLGLKKDIDEELLPSDVISIRGFRTTCDCYPLIDLKNLLIDNIANKEDGDESVREIILEKIKDICG